MVAVSFKEGVVEVEIWLGDAIEDGGGVAEGGEGVAEDEEARDDDWVLLRVLADDLGVDLFEGSKRSAGAEESEDRRGAGHREARRGGRSSGSIRWLF